jgi:hypothetical protein
MAITLLNNTQYPAQYTILKGQLVATSLTTVAPGASVLVPAESLYTVNAATTLDGNLHTSAPLRVSPGVGFSAGIRQDAGLQTYMFEVLEIPSSGPNQLEFESSCKSEVVFTILKNSRPLQSIVLTEPFKKSILALSDTYSVRAVINGVTTDVATTNDPNATITAVDDTADSSAGYYTLRVSA